MVFVIVHIAFAAFFIGGCYLVFKVLPSSPRIRLPKGVASQQAVAHEQARTHTYLARRAQRRR